MMASRGFPNGQEEPVGDDDEGHRPLSRSATGSSRVLDSRLRRMPTATAPQTYNPAMASILSACQGMSEDSLMVMADMINYVCKRQGGRATGKRRGAQSQAEAPLTVDHVSEWAEQQNEALGISAFDSEYSFTHTARSTSPAAPRPRRTSSCPPPGDGEIVFAKGTRVAAVKAIKSKKVVVVSDGTKGTVNYETSNGRVNVTFDARCDAVEKAINVRAEYLVAVDAPASSEGTGSRPASSRTLTSLAGGGSASKLLNCPPAFQSTGFGQSPPPSPSTSPAGSPQR